MSYLYTVLPWGRGDHVLLANKKPIAMLGAFYKSNPFINCAAQIINS